MAIPLVLVFSTGPGLLFVRRLRWSPLEKIAGSIALSLILLFSLTFGAYAAGLPTSAYYGVTTIAGVLTVMAWPDLWSYGAGCTGSGKCRSRSVCSWRGRSACKG